MITMMEEKERVMHDVSAGECVSLQKCQLAEIKLKLVPEQHAAEITALAGLFAASSSSLEFVAQW